MTRRNRPSETRLPQSRSKAPVMIGPSEKQFCQTANGFSDGLLSDKSDY
ncbi:hypothetical protein NEIELOOT_01079 [Neisseria elongata subsp. glycolytica ATCC 29315]|uniref:Uncharacterized protein n=1 Tax=Neisseria elongata subsp. glycolytica ATCC 29315 TaxID=546263 RepID=D4DPU2_NEIEG|nr:hypothetical protein NEIELOOT_01079 [Neisseria elongata subsp. glycolytica ATCC 29315]